MDSRTQVILLRSASRNFPVDLEPELSGAGYAVTSVETFQQFIGAPARHLPALVLIEIGSLEELHRAVLVVDWAEHVQPFAPARFMLLLASKNFQVGEHKHKLANAEIVALPQPTRNLLFKMELQSRLLAKPFGARANTDGFTAKLEEVAGQGNKRVLAVRGRGPESGSWKEHGSAPSGKVRWRWISMPQAAPTAGAAFTWQVESESAPRFDASARAWYIEGEDASITCQHGGETIYAAAAGTAAPKPAGAKSGGGAPVSTAAASVPNDAGTETGRKSAVRAPAEPKEAPQKIPASKPVPGTEEGKTSPVPAARAAPETPETNVESRNRTGAGHANSVPQGVREGTTPESAPWNTNSQSPLAAPVAAPAKPAGSVPPARAKNGKSALERAEEALAEHEPRASDPEREAPAKTAPSWNVREGTSGASVPAAAGGTASGPGKETLAPFNVPKPAAAGAPVSAAREGTPGAVEEKKSAERKQGEAKPAPTASAAGTSRDVPPPGEKAPPSSSPAGELLQDGGTRPVREPLPSLGDAVPSVSAEPPRGTLEAPAPAWSNRVGSEGQPMAPSNLTVPSRGADAPRESGAPAEASPITAVPAKERDPVEAPAGPAITSRAEAPPTDASRPRGFEQPLLGEKSGTPGAGAPISIPSAGSAGAAKAEKETRVQGTGASAEEEDSRRYLKQRHFELMTLTQLGDRESSWHPVGRYRIYLAAQHRYYGLKHLQEALPLWIYDGELAPEFLDAQAAWKFYDRLPVAVASLESVPQEVMEYLYRLCGLEMPHERMAKQGMKAGPGVVVVNTSTETRARPPGSTDPYQPEAVKPAVPKGALASLVQAIKKLFGGQ